MDDIYRTTYSIQSYERQEVESLTLEDLEEAYRLIANSNLYTEPSSDSISMRLLRPIPLSTIDSLPVFTSYPHNKNNYKPPTKETYRSFTLYADGRLEIEYDKE